ncbi:hypothetical protein [Halobacillus naozhouensis]|uniref:Lipoprotein n=1 Tax=Halobacillus naozhouensis TaxID=554880 RepID=A0ABY8ITX7_9BACI|nr:hypothetical protein [Halobacillus naozhouensis]WFT73528.1 hypothetical protein P9989_14190 [Halobacillus naozhouensis]
MYLIKGILFIVLAMLLGGCNFMLSEKEAISQTKEASLKAFEQESMEPNYDGQALSMYLPGSMEVKQQANNNIVMTEGNEQTYILFYNSMESQASRLNYKAASTIDKSLLFQSYKDEDRFSYVRVLPLNKEEEYELQVSVGGVKITTYTEKGELVSDSEKMMEIANSVQYSGSLVRE